MKPLLLLFLATALAAQVQPAPGWCSMAHCNNQLTDFVPLAPIGLTSSVYVMNRDTARSGVKFGLACVSNGTNFACSYNQSPDALVYYDADGHVLWTSGSLLDANTYIAAPLIQADGSVVIGDDQHIYKFNSDGTVAWSTASPGGQPSSLVTTPNGAIVAATVQVAVNPCLENNCQLAVTVNTPGIQYTTASVTLAGGDCPGAAATAAVSGGQVTGITVTSQGAACVVPPDIIIQGDGSGAVAGAQLNSPAPVAVYNGTTGALVGSLFLYQSGISGPYYVTTNVPCVNNGSYPNRTYISTNLPDNKSQGALWALDIDPNNPAQPITPAWNIIFGGPSGASPLCVGNNLYFDGAGFMPGDTAGTTIFGAQDNGSSGSLLFHVSLGPGTGAVTSNFALDPRAVGGFWHQIQGDPNIYHRDAATGALIEQIDTSTPLVANGALPATYWDAGVFTTLGTAGHPYFVLSELAPLIGSYAAMYDLTNAALIWALPIYPGNSPFAGDTEEGAAALAVDPQGNSVVAVASRYNGAYFIANGPAELTLSTSSLSFGKQAVGSSSAAESIAVTNNASAALNISGITAGGDFAQANNCGAALPAGRTCTIAVVFRPTATGARSGAITISSNAAGSPQTVTLSGAGITGQPVIGLSPTTLTFPSQPAGTTSRAQVAVLTNNGSAPLAISNIAASGDAAQSNACPATLAPGANCLILVMFAPIATGTRTGAVTVTGSAPHSPRSIAVAGTGAATPSLAVGLSLTSLVFPAQMAGTTSAPQTITVSNPGTAAVAIASIAASGDSAQSNTCPASLAAGASCQITVTFTPAAVGARSGTISIMDNAAGSPQTIAVSGTGTGHPAPLLNQPLAPASQLPGAPGFTLNVQGGGFTSGAVVDWNGAPLATSFINSTRLSATVAASALATAGTAWINVSNPEPGGGLSNTTWFPIATPVASLQFSLANLPAGAAPQALAAADFNADGQLDLVVANSAAHTVSILLGNGDGSFAARVDYPTGNQPVAVAAGDFNGDGKLDLAVVNQADNTVSILLGNGDGTFAAAQPYATGNGPAGIALADFNGDGNLDLAIANRLDNTVSILPGSGNGAFGAHLDYAAGQAPTALAVADFNADGALDLAVANDFFGGTVSVLLGNPDGTLQSPVSYTTGDSVALIAADLNGDGQLDLAAVNRMQQTLSVLLGNGDGTFQAAEANPLTCPPDLGVSGQGLSMCELDPGPSGLAVGDMNGDGTLELAVINSTSGTVSILPGDGNGVFRKIAAYPTATGPAALVMADFNGDGSLDLAVAASSNTISILLQSPAAVPSPSSLSFGNVNAGSSATQTVTVTNGGSALLRITGITASGSFSQTNTCGMPLAPGSACSITVTFSPASAGPQTGLLSIMDNAPASPQTISLSGNGVLNLSLNLSSTTIIGGNTLSSNTVTLSSPAPSGGAVVALSSSNPTVAAVPASVTVAAGSTISPAFSIATTGVATPNSVAIMASYSGSTSTAMLTVNPAALVSITLSPAAVISGLSTTSNTVTLNGGAPPAGAVVNLSSANPSVAAVPASVTIPANGGMSPAFTITAGFVSTPAQVVISATYGTTTVMATLTVNPVGVSSVSLSPTSVVGGKPPANPSNTVVLNAPAPPGAAVVTLSSSNSAVAAVPASVTVAAGAITSPNFTITTTAVAKITMVTISANYNGATATAVLTVNPATIQSVKLAQTNVIGGTSIPSNRVLLNGPAPPAGATLVLSSSNPAVAAVPASVRVPAGAASSQNFTIATTAVTSSTTVTISATYLKVTKSATLTVTP